MPFASLSVSVCVSLSRLCLTNAYAVGNRGLSCKRSAGKTLRHNYLNDLVYNTLLQASLSFIKESAGLCRTDGKQPNGLKNVPSHAGKSAV